MQEFTVIAGNFTGNINEILIGMYNSIAAYLLFD